VQWCLTDHLNSVRLVLDASGAILDQIASDAFGNIVARLNPLVDNPLLFASREFDAETGLYYNRARYLDPSTGRWTTQDPMGFAAGDANLYRYVGNRATLATDPSGNIAWFVAVPLVMSVGGFTWLTGSTALVSYRTTGSWWDAGTWGASWDGLRLGIQANINGLATAGRSLLTLGLWNEPWEVWAVDQVDRPYYNDAFLATRFGWELLPTAVVGRLTQTAGQIGRWGRWALGWDAGQNAVQAGRGGYDIYENGLTWTNGLQVIGSLLGLGGNYATWRRLPAGSVQAWAGPGSFSALPGSTLASRSLPSWFRRTDAPVNAKVVNIGGPIRYGDYTTRRMVGPQGQIINTMQYSQVNPRFLRPDFVDINLQGTTVGGRTLPVDFNTATLTDIIAPGVRFLRGSNIPVEPVPSGIWVQPEAIVQQANALGVRHIAISTGRPNVLANALREAGWEVRIRSFRIKGMPGETWDVVTATRRVPGR
jgi:RHS repeat-associated protein